MTKANQQFVWHPFTQHGLEHEMIEIARSDGAWLTTRDGQRIFDAISSWWVVTHGHRHPKIIAAIKDQADKLDQVIFAGLTHEPAEAVARELIKIVPAGLERVFFSDSGSTAVEVAIKMALGYWRNRGEARTRILALEHAYHGDTVGTMSAGARGVFNASYEPLLFDVGRVPLSDDGNSDKTLQSLEAYCQQGDVAAFLCEPLILGAGGMVMYDATLLSAMRTICAKYRVLFIADEVMTGFGRTGTPFAVEQAGISPDILCLGKGLTGGSIPLAVTLSTAEIFDAHVSHDRGKMLFHSSSYTANPIACAAAVANLRLWETEPVRARVSQLASFQSGFASQLSSDKRFSDVRQCGTIMAFDLARAAKGYLADEALKIRNASIKRGVLVRPLGGTIYTMPPYCTTREELDGVYRAISDVVDEVSA